MKKGSYPSLREGDENAQAFMEEKRSILQLKRRSTLDFKIKVHSRRKFSF